MATRFYLPATEAAAVNPANTADWSHVQGSPVFRRLQKPYIAVALATTAVTPDSSDHLVAGASLHRTYVSDPLAAQTISGNIKAQFQVLEAHANNNLAITLKVFRVNSSGVLQDVMLAITSKGTEPTTSLRNTSFANAALTSRTFTEGDRIAIEIGLAGTPGPAASQVQGHNGSIRWGTTATSGDLPEDESTSGTTYRPWIEFDGNIAFAPNRPTAEIVATSGVAATISAALMPVVSTQDATDLADTTATANGTLGGNDCEERGFVYSKTSRSDPGNVAPGSSAYEYLKTEVGQRRYTKVFSGSENPISDGGEWVNNSVSWHRLQLLTGVAATTGANAGYDDSYAHLLGFVDPDQDVSARIFVASDMADCSHQPSILLRVTDGDDFCSGYQVWFQPSLTAGSIQCIPVKWNGAMGSYFGFNQSGTKYPTGGPGGVICRVRIVGHILTAWIDGEQMWSFDVTSESQTALDSGQPGLSVYRSTDCDQYYDRSAGWTEIDAVSGSNFSSGAFTGSLTGLDAGTTYYIRAYAKNVNGYSYGDEVSFDTTGGGPQTYTPVTSVVAQSGVPATYSKQAVLTVAGQVDAQSGVPATFSKQAVLTVAGDVPGTSGIAATYLQPLSVSTQAATNVEDTTATGNGTVIGNGCDERGIVYSTSSHGNPGNVTPGSSGYAGRVYETGSFDPGAFSEALVNL